MSTIYHSIPVDCLSLICGGQLRSRPNIRHEIDPISPMLPGSGDVGAPVHGSRGPLTARESRFANGAYTAREVAGQQLGLHSRSGAVESRQWRAIVEGAYDR